MKTKTGRKCAEGVAVQGWEPFAGRFWQRNYYEHIIRTEADLQRIQTYIANNPLAWANDPEKPGHDTGSM